MPGFMEIAIIGEHFAQRIVNTFAYRSTEYNPLGGDPFGDALKVCDDFWANCGTEYLTCFNANYRALRLEATVHQSNWDIVNNSPAVRTIDQPGAQSLGGSLETTGSSVVGILGFYLGQQHQISGVGSSPRNRGYIALGPIPEVHVDSYGHLSNSEAAAFDALGAKLDDVLVDVPLTASFTPIRIHQKFGPKLPLLQRPVLYRTYSDVIGYRLPRVASWRRSRMPEA